MTEAQGTELITLVTDVKTLLEWCQETLQSTNALLGGLFVALLGILFFTAFKAVRRDG